MNFFQKMVNQKVNNISTHELIRYCSDYGIYITEEQASQVVSIIREDWVDIYNENDRIKLFKKIKVISDEETVKKVEELMEKLI